jgi:hypothetical protein
MSTAIDNPSYMDHLEVETDTNLISTGTPPYMIKPNEDYDNPELGFDNLHNDLVEVDEE